MSAIDNFKRNHNMKHSKYEYILDTRDVIEKIAEQKADLNYNLRKEVKRDRFVANAKGLEEAIIMSVNKVILSECDRIAEVIARDIEMQIQRDIAGVMIGNARSTSNIKTSFKMDLGKILGRELGKLSTALIDEIMKDTM